MDINELIERLMAIECYAKDIHYTCTDYSKHLLADLVHDGIDDFIDSLKENCFLGQRKLPLASKEYMAKAIEFIPDIREGKDRENFISLNGLIDDTRRELKSIKVESRGANSLFDSIGEHLDKSSGLLYIQTRLTEGLNEEKKEDEKLKPEKEEVKGQNEEKIDTKSTATEDIKVEHDHKANTETPIDRKVFTDEELKPTEDQKVALKYDAENVLVAEETNIDKLYNKVQEMGL